MGETVEECRRHLGVAEDGGPFSERQVGGDDDGGALVEPADEMEDELDQSEPLELVVTDRLGPVLLQPPELPCGKSPTTFCPYRHFAKLLCHIAVHLRANGRSGTAFE